MALISSPASICIIIPTTCETSRWAMLNRAIASVHTQKNVHVQVLVVVNGVRFDAEHLKTLKTRSDLSVHYELVGSLPLALHIGRSLIDTDFFGFLDDDDVYLPDALANRLGPMLEDGGVDFVASNGLRREEGKPDIPFLTDVAGINDNPLAALNTKNWLSSCGGLYRSAKVLASDIDPELYYLEWTFLAFKLAGTHRMVFVDKPTFCIYSTVGSLSKSEAYLLAEPVVLRKILALNLPKSVRQPLQYKLGRVHHNLAEYARRTGQLKLAWRHHLASLYFPGGRNYLTYTRYLLTRKKA